MYEIEEVSETEGKTLAKENGAIFKLTSAKHSTGIEQLFEIIAKRFVNPNYLDNSHLTKNQDEELSMKNRIEYLRGKSIHSQNNKLKKEEEKNVKKCC